MDLTRGGPGGLCPDLYERCEPVSLTGLQKSPLSAGFFFKDRPSSIRLQVLLRLVPRLQRHLSPLDSDRAPQNPPVKTVFRPTL